MTASEEEEQEGAKKDGHTVSVALHHYLPSVKSSATEQQFIQAHSVYTARD